MRVKVPIAVIDPATGNAIAGASVQVKKRADGTNATLYAAETGPTTSTNPTVTDTYGRVGTWVDRGAYTAVISGTGLTTFNQDFDAAAASDGAGETKWLSTPDWVTALPSSPVNGQELFFLADATNGVLWNLKYRAASASPYKWEYLGGGALKAENVGGRDFNVRETISTLSQGTLATAGPAVTVPLAGDYVQEGKASLVQIGAGGAPTAFLWTAADGALTWNQADIVFSANSANAVGTGFGRKTRLGLAANTVLEMRYASSGSGVNAGFYDRSLWVTPIRVG